MADTVREQLRRHADSDVVAIRYEDTSITWRDYLAGADARAGAVTGMLDPARPLHVATLLENTPEMLYALAAGAAGGYVIVGLNATRRGEGLARDIRKAECQVILTDRELKPLLDGLDLGEVSVIDTDSDEWAALVASSSAPQDPPPVEAMDPFIGLTSEDVLYLSMPLFHSNAIMSGFSPAIAAGATMALARRFSATRFGDDIRRYGVTYMNYVGKPLAYILDTPPRPDHAPRRVRQRGRGQGHPRLRAAVRVRGPRRLRLHRTRGDHRADRELAAGVDRGTVPGGRRV